MDCEELFISCNNLPSVLTKEESYDFLLKIRDGDMEARKTFIEHSIRLVLYEVTKKFYYSYDDIKELVSCGVEGLVKAVDSFDISKGLSFSTYAIKCIDNEIKNFLKRYYNDYNIYSLGKVLWTNKDGETFLIKDILFDDVDIERDYLKEEVLSVVKDVISGVSDRDRQIICMYFGFKYRIYSQNEIARELGVSQNLISLRLNKVLNKCREALRKFDLIDLDVFEKYRNKGKKRNRKKEVRD